MIQGVKMNKSCLYFLAGRGQGKLRLPQMNANERFCPFLDIFLTD